MSMIINDATLTGTIVKEYNSNNQNLRKFQVLVAQRTKEGVVNFNQMAFITVSAKLAEINGLTADGPHHWVGTFTGPISFDYYSDSNQSSLSMMANSVKGNVGVTLGGEADLGIFLTANTATMSLRVDQVWQDQETGRMTYQCSAPNTYAKDNFYKKKMTVFVGAHAGLQPLQVGTDFVVSGEVVSYSKKEGDGWGPKKYRLEAFAIFPATKINWKEKKQEQQPQNQGPQGGQGGYVQNPNQGQTYPQTQTSFGQNNFGPGAGGGVESHFETQMDPNHYNGNVNAPTPEATMPFGGTGSATSPQTANTFGPTMPFGGGTTESPQTPQNPSNGFGNNLNGGVGTNFGQQGPQAQGGWGANNTAGSSSVGQEPGMNLGVADLPF